jgi:quinoprotein glucose dehydrogenase
MLKNILLILLFSSFVFADDKIQITKFAKKPDVVNPVTITFDYQNRAYIGGTIRRRSGSLDIRGLRSWVKNDLSFESLEDRQKFYKEVYKEGAKSFKYDFNKDGAKDWKDLMFPEDPLKCYIDSNGDGKVDKIVKIDNKTTTFGAGILAGSLWHDGHLYTVHEPDVWKYTDTDNDGIPDKRQSISRGYSIHIGQGGHNASGLAIGMDGRLYWSVADKGINAKSPDGKNHVWLPHRGAVMRCELDGSNLEAFTLGVRNAQELAFDKYNNIFSVDNDGDYPTERERFLYLIEGGMTGWRLHWQWHGLQEFVKVSGEKPYNVWMKDKMSFPQNPTQPAYIVPTLKNYKNGPCGMEYNPGTALSKEFLDCLFHASGGDITAFRVKQKGAAFEMIDEKVIAKGKVLTGLAFSPNGALYAGSCLGYPNYPATNGFVLKIDVEKSDLAVLRKETAAILAKGFKNLSEAQLAKNLSHQDLRVRRDSQFELVKRGSSGQKVLINTALKGSGQLARLHGIWGTGQIGRKTASAVAPLIPLLQDKDPQVRAQTAVVIGDAKYKEAALNLIKLLKDPSPRVQSLAAIALGKLNNVRSITPLLALAEQNNDKDPFLRHSIVMGLQGSARDNPSLLSEVSNHHSAASRMVALLALRRLSNPGIAVFLKDKNMKIVAEAARAIHDDFSIPAALPALAASLKRKDLSSEPLLRRAINANLRVGKAENALILKNFIANSTAPENMKTTALASLAYWEMPPQLDPVEGRSRKYTKRDKAPAVEALKNLAVNYIPKAPKRIVQIYLRAIKKINAPELSTSLGKIYDNGSSAVKIEVLQALKDTKSKDFKTYAEKAFQSPDKKLKNTAAILLGKISSKGILAKLKSKNTNDQKEALGLLVSFPDKKTDQLLTTYMKDLQNHKDIAVEILESAQLRSAKNRSLQKLLKNYHKKNSKGIDPYKILMYGGDAAKGKEVAMGHPAAQCIRCHKIGKVGGILGPDLSQLAKNLSPEKILESLIEPSAEFSKGFGIFTLNLKNGKSVTGTFKDKDKTHYSLLSAVGKTIKIALKDIKSESKLSTMPPMKDILNKVEIRNLLKYLSTLK